MSHSQWEAPMVMNWSLLRASAWPSSAKRRSTGVWGRGLNGSKGPALPRLSEGITQPGQGHFGVDLLGTSARRAS